MTGVQTCALPILISALADKMPWKVYSNTPNIDRLVNIGTSFTNAYCSNSVSVPSRFSLFTGMYGGQFQIRENKCENIDESVIRKFQSKNALGVLFAQNGYDTYYGGKVHLPLASLEGTSKFKAPTAYGFENYYTKNEREGLGLASAELLTDLASKQANSDIWKPFLMVASFLNPHDICLESSTNLSSEIISDDLDKVATVQMMRDRIAAIDSIEFYQDYAPSMPVNWDKTVDYPSTKCSKKRFLNYPEYYWRKYRWIYGEMVSLVDDHIGNILDVLDRFEQLKNNTIIVFTSDHGEMQGAHGCVTKSMPFEECQRVPFIIAGTDIKHQIVDGINISASVDLLPTLCDLANIPKPDLYDGISLTSLIQGEKSIEDFHEKRKYIYLESETFISILHNQYKYIFFDKDGQYDLLFDLYNDPQEMYNIASDNIELVEGFRKILNERFR